MNRKSPLSRFSRLLSLASVLLLSALWFLPSALAQGVTATLTGTVQDQNGAVVPGAMVTVLNPSTALERHATTTDDGYFTIPLLPPGTYSVTARRDGFSPVEFRNLVLNVGDQKSLQIQLKAGDVNATVTVDSSAETVRTDGSVGTVINRQFVANIPLNGRSLQALIQMTPGVVLAPLTVSSSASGGSGTATGGGQFSVSGSRTTSNYFMVDGVSANTGIAGSTFYEGAAGSGQTPGTTVLGGTNSLVSLDALQEFRIETSSYAAEFGRTPGGQISLLTRSGTNQFHGSASYYFRNEALDANDWFANSRRLPKPKERQNFVGGVFGGPIKRDRLFFFGSYEGLRLKQPKVTLATVPTLGLRALAALAARPYLNALPLPNGRDFGNGTAEFAASYSNPGTFNIFALRLDGRVTSNLTGFFRINHAPSEAQTRGGSLSQVSSINAGNNSYTGGMTWVVGSRLTTDLRVNWTRNQIRQDTELDNFGGAVIPRISDVFMPGRDPSKAVSSLMGSFGGFAWGANNSDVQRQFNTVGSVALSAGSHQLKFGVDYRRLRPLLGASGLSFEALYFFSVQSIVTGPADAYQRANGDTVPREPIISNLSLFAQDTWHATRRLTLTYGFRFERVPPPSEATGRLPRTVLGIENDPPQSPRLAPPGTPLFRGRFGEFAPRVGVAYQLSTRPGREATLRGGTGIFYDIGLGNIANDFATNFPFFINQFIFGVPLPLSDTIRIPPKLGVDPPDSMYLLDPNLRLPYAIQWNATWEQGVGQGQVVTVSYVGAAGRRLLLYQNYNTQSLAEWPNRNVPLKVQRNLGQSSYQALQVQFQRRLRSGLQAMASYALARSRDNGSGDDSLSPSSSQAALLAREYGPSDLDVRHVMSGALTYELPGSSRNVLLRALSKDWGVDLMVRYQSALPMTPFVGFGNIGNGSFIRRPDIVPGQPLYIEDPAVPGGRRFNSAAFTTPAPGQQGSFPRNGLRGFPASQVDLALRREFKLREPVRLQLRAELFNLFNHPNFGPPASRTTDALFGQPTSMLNQSLGGLNPLYQMGGPRSVQLAVKLMF